MRVSGSVHSRNGVSMSWRLLALAASLLVAISAAQPAAAANFLYGSSSGGDLFRIDTTTGKGAFVELLPPFDGSGSGATEIECDSAIPPVCYVQFPDGAFAIRRFSPDIGPTTFDGASFTGLEFVGGTLYGTAITMSNGPSTLRTLDPNTGASITIGLTGVGPISGLAFDIGTSTMYGIGGGSGPSVLYTINLATGLATPVGNTGLRAGSLQFGPDGNLYAGTTGITGGDLFRIDPLTAQATLVGPTGFDTVTGLTLSALIAIEAPAPVLSWSGSFLVVASLLMVAARSLRGASAG